MTTSEFQNCPKLNALKTEGEEKIILKVQMEKSASDKAVELDPYLAPHKDIIQSR